MSLSNVNRISAQKKRWPVLGLVLLALTMLFTLTAQAAIITVNTTADEVNNDGDCSLREAIRAANLNQVVDACPAGSGADTIILPAGVYDLTIAGASESAALTGDLNITEGLTITGSGANNTIIDANGLDRVFDIVSPTPVLISGVTIQGGDSGSRAGGGIRVGSGSLTLASSRVRNNTGSDAIYVLFSAALTITNSRIHNNTDRGVFVGGTATINQSTISGNTATNPGAGIASTGALTITNSTISGNSTDTDGGGIRSDGTANLYNVTITNNTANADGVNFDGGGGISALGGTFTIRNSIIAGNIHINASPVPDCSGTISSAGYNLIQNLTGCTISGDTTGNITGVSPNLGPLQNNGGTTQTHALLTGSLAINAGNPTGCLDQHNALLTTDQRGYARSGVCDIGAFEYDSPGTPTPTATPTHTPTGTLTPTSPTPDPAPSATPTPPGVYLPIIHK